MSLSLFISSSEHFLDLNNTRLRGMEPGTERNAWRWRTLSQLEPLGQGGGKRNQEKPRETIKSFQVGGASGWGAGKQGSPEWNRAHSPP